MEIVAEVQKKCRKCKMEVHPESDSILEKNEFSVWNCGELQVKLEFSIQNWGKLQVKLEFCHVGTLHKFILTNIPR